MVEEYCTQPLDAVETMFGKFRSNLLWSLVREDAIHLLTLSSCQNLSRFEVSPHKRHMGWCEAIIGPRVDIGPNGDES